jgi:Sulfotransferase family
MMKFLALFFLGLVHADPQLVFYHIPKTAGCTTRFLLETQYDFKDVCPSMFYFEIESKRPKDLEKYQLFSGHFFFNSNLKYIDAKRITFMRDPIERIISEQRFYKKFYEDSERRSLLSIQHYNPEGDPIDNVSNLQVLYLSSLDRNDLSLSYEKHYESALYNLKHHFDFVGIVEDYERSIRSLFDLMGWRQMEIIPVLQSAEVALEVDQIVIEEIKKRNQYDIMLYEEAKKLFYSKFLVTDYKKKNVDEFFEDMRIDFDKKIPGEGFGSPVYFYDLLYRPIVASGRAFLDLPLKAGSEYGIIFYANKTIKDPKFRIICKGRDLEYTSSKSKTFVKIPKELISSSEETRIELIVEDLNQDDLKWDRTKISSGYAFRRIDINALD